MSTPGFHDVRFPTSIGFGSSGGPEFLTEVTSLDNGSEQRNSRWAQSKSRYDVAGGIKTFEDLYSVYDFFIARHGKAYSFRFKDILDYGNGSWASGLFVPEWETVTSIVAGVFQLTKQYGTYPNEFYRNITKPVSGTVRIKVNGTELTAPPTSPSQFSVDTDTGLVTIHKPPGSGSTITFTCQFDVQVRFDTDFLSLNLSDYLAGRASIPVVGVPA